MAEINMNQGWNDAKTRIPAPTQGDGDEPAVVSDDVLVYFEGVGFDIAVYDHERHAWLLPNKNFARTDGLPRYWRPLPSLPQEHKKS